MTTIIELFEFIRINHAIRKVLSSFCGDKKRKKERCKLFKIIFNSNERERDRKNCIITNYKTIICAAVCFFQFLHTNVSKLNVIVTRSNE